jgi:hypothetical protein
MIEGKKGQTMRASPNPSLQMQVFQLAVFSTKQLQAPIMHHQGSMICDQKTVCCWVPVP